MVHFKKLNKRLSDLEDQLVLTRRPSWCDLRRRLAKCNALLNGRGWTCPVKLTPEREAWRVAQQAQYQDYFDKLDAEGRDGTPASERVERRVPRSRHQPLENLFDIFEERDRNEEQCHEKT